MMERLIALSYLLAASTSLSHRAEPVSLILWAGLRLYRYTREVKRLHKNVDHEVYVVSKAVYWKPIERC